MIKLIIIKKSKSNRVNPLTSHDYGHVIEIIL
jgi:hypothetical protein